MRSIVIAVTLVSATASVAHAQQAQSLRPTIGLTAQSQQVPVTSPTPSTSPRIVDAPIGITRAQARAVESNKLTKTTGAAVDSNTRNTLAIVGAVVIVLALIAFLL
jgi:hypothetical protein